MHPFLNAMEVVLVKVGSPLVISLTTPCTPWRPFRRLLNFMDSMRLSKLEAENGAEAPSDCHKEYYPVSNILSSKYNGQQHAFEISYFNAVGSHHICISKAKTLHMKRPHCRLDH